MKKYNIEGGIDFFGELYKSLDVNDNINKTEEDDNLCLITYQALQDKFVQLECGHKFNYTPLYLDIKNHKQKFNNMEGQSTRLNINEIRCPYCRKIHKNLLEYYEELGLPKINGVNYVDPKYSEPTSYYNQQSKKCQFVSPNPNNDNEPIKCFSFGYQINYSDKKDLLNTNFGDEKYYCWHHKMEMIRKYKKEYYDKKKQEQAQAKLLAKQEIKKAKEDQKQLQKALKKLQKLKKMEKELTKCIINTKLENILNENSVIGTIDIIENSENLFCPVILKSGANKGNVCGKKNVENGFCKRHSKSFVKPVENV